jgi:putative DNA primase/helicase
VSSLLMAAHKALQAGTKLEVSQPETPTTDQKLQFVPHKVIEQSLAAQASTLLPMWLPGGSFNGHEYICANIRGGGHSSSFRVFRSGDSWGWNDFAVKDQHGHGMINLYAAIQGLQWREARDELIRTHGVLSPDQIAAMPPPPPKPVVDHDPVVPPHSEWNFDGDPIWYLNDIQWAMEYGNLLGLPAPAMHWTFRLKTGEPWCVVARFNLDDGGKLPLPWYWSESEQHWVPRRYAEESLIIYNLDMIHRVEDSVVIVGEGEKVAGKLSKILDYKKFTPTTFMGGVNAILKSDWSPLAGRKVVLWPDADEPGRDAMKQLAKHLIEDVGVHRLYILDVDDYENGWDAADAIDEGWNAEQIIGFIHDRKGSGVSRVRVKEKPQIQDYEYEQLCAILRKLKFNRLTPGQQWASLLALKQALFPKRDAREWFQREDFDALWDGEDKKKFQTSYLDALLRKQK